MKYIPNRRGTLKDRVRHKIKGKGGNDDTMSVLNSKFVMCVK
jgi:hypothetical protein